MLALTLLAHKNLLVSRDDLHAALLARHERDRALLPKAAARAAALHNLVAQRIAVVRRLGRRSAREPHLRGPRSADLHRSLSRREVDRVLRDAVARGLRVDAAEE